MVLFNRENEMEETMPQTVPSAGFTPPCDYSAFADSFDLSLLPGGDPFSSLAPPFDRSAGKPKTHNSFYSSLSEAELDLCPDFHTLLVPGEDSPKGSYPSIYLDVASPGTYPVAALSPASQGLLSPFGGYRLSGEVSFYPSSPEESVYSTSPCGEEYSYVKKEGYSSDSSLSPLPNFNSFGIKEEVSFADSPEPDVLTADKRIKQEESDPYRDSRCLRQLLESGHSSPIGGHNSPFSGHNSPIGGRNSPPEDHKLLREALNDTSFQKRFNIRPIDLGFFDVGEVKMEEAERSDAKAASEAEDYLLRGCEEGIVQENIAPVLNLAIEQMREDVDSTCAILGISTDPSQWNSASVLSWIRWTSRQFGLPEPTADQWDMPGPTLVALSEEDFTRRAPQGGMILHAQLEIWKAAYSDEDLRMQWRPETTSSNASSGDISEDEEEEPVPTTPDQPATTPAKPSTSRPSTHIHLWQFLKELLASPQAHGSCIRWLDRANGIFKIEDSVKVAKLWGKRKNRPAMNYDKLSRSIRQYYKKGIMKKTERSQRLVYQFCHPYNL